jgi:hypothetical protein
MDHTRDEMIMDDQMDYTREVVELPKITYRCGSEYFVVCLHFRFFSFSKNSSMRETHQIDTRR